MECILELKEDVIIKKIRNSSEKKNNFDEILKISNRRFYDQLGVCKSTLYSSLRNNSPR